MGCAHASGTARPAEPAAFVEPEASEAVLGAEDLLSSGEYAQAETQLERVVAEHPEDARAWLDLGLAREGLGLPKQAGQAYRRATEIEPAFAEAFNNLGVVSREQGLLDEAIDALGRAVRLKPGLVDARLNLAMAYEDAGRTEEAMSAYHQVIKLDPSDPIPRINLGLLQVGLGEFSEARATLQAARKLSRGDADLLTAVGGGLRRAKAPAVALSTLKQAMDAAGGEPSAGLLGELALAYYANGKFGDAERTMKRALLGRPKDSALRYAYSSMLLRNGKQNAARRELGAIIKSDPRSDWATRARARLKTIKSAP